MQKNLTKAEVTELVKGYTLVSETQAKCSFNGRIRIVRVYENGLDTILTDYFMGAYDVFTGRKEYSFLNARYSFNYEEIGNVVLFMREGEECLQS